MKKHPILFLTFAVLAFYACRSNKEEIVTKGEEYFPLQVGLRHTYKIDTVVFDLFQKTIDTFSNVVYEEIVEKYVDLNGDTMYRIELSTYNDVKKKNVVFKSFTRNIKNNFAFENMNNSTEVKMIFPISSYKTKGSNYTWNSNMFNSRDPDIVKYTSVFTPYNNGSSTFNDCVSIKLNKRRIQSSSRTTAKRRKSRSSNLNSTPCIGRECLNSSKKTAHGPSSH